jgi:hypothetical protein
MAEDGGFRLSLFSTAEIGGHPHGQKRKGKAKTSAVKRKPIVKKSKPKKKRAGDVADVS